MTGQPQKVAILGGGMSALTAAYYLSDPAQNGKYEITVYELGWRLGGKGASGRNAEVFERIEEHGLHIWFGCYHNALKLMRECYPLLERPAGAPLSTMDDAFKEQNDLVLREHIDGTWRRWPFHFLPYPFESEDVPTVLGFLKRIVRWLEDKLVDLDDHLELDLVKDLDFDDALVDRIGGLIDDALGRTAARPKSLVSRLRKRVDALSDDFREIDPDDLDLIPIVLEALSRALWFLLRDKLPNDDDARHLWILSYLGMTVAKGMIEDDLWRDGYDSIEAIEFRDWLRKHSSMEGVDKGLPDDLAINSANLQAYYDAAFSFLGGNTTTPNMSATVALRTMLRVLLDYRGGFVYEMQAGMGDTVFTPLYLILKQRGVRFEFFARITELGLNSNQRSIETITGQYQVKLNGDYDPLVKVKDLLCWPSEPRYDQIKDGDKLKESGANLGHWDSGWSDVGDPIELVKGQDFDLVLLGISYICLPFVTKQLAAASAPWQTMIQGLNAVDTQAWQAWFTKDRAQLKMPGPPSIIGAYIEPWSSLTDFSHLIAREDWPAGSVSYLCYSCGVMEPGAGANDDAVFQRFRDLVVKEFAPLWPGAARIDDPSQIDWSALWAPDGVTGEARLSHQYWRANSDPTEQYVMSSAGTSPARLKADGTAFDNLTIAGEWVDTGLNISSIETTVMSGMQASRAISGFPKKIIGEVDV